MFLVALSTTTEMHKCVRVVGSGTICILYLIVLCHITMQIRNEIYEALQTRSEYAIRVSLRNNNPARQANFLNEFRILENSLFMRRIECFFVDELGIRAVCRRKFHDEEWFLFDWQSTHYHALSLLG